MAPAPASASAPAPQAPGGGRRERALYRKFYQEARRQLQAEEYLELQRARAHTDYGTTYEEDHGRPGFEPALERQLREGAALAELQPLDASEPALSLWYCLQRGGAGRRVSPAHSAPQPFRRTSAFTTPTHLSLHESPVELAARGPQPRPRVSLMDQLQVRGWLPAAGPPGPGLEWGPTAPRPRPHRYPLADVLPDAGKKHWCDRHEDPIREAD